MKTTSIGVASIIAIELIDLLPLAGKVADATTSLMQVAIGALTIAILMRRLKEGKKKPPA